MKKGGSESRRKKGREKVVERRSEKQKRNGKRR